MAIQYIETARLHPHPQNPRKDLGDLGELCESIRHSGILQNLTVVPQLDENGFVTEDYTVIIGHRRLAAAKAIGLEKLPCSVEQMSEKEQLATMLAENMQRADLTPYEQARGMQLMLDLGENAESVAKMTGLSESTVRRRVKLAALPEKDFEESYARGARLEDYEKLDKLTDPKNRKKALKAIGTPNFDFTIRSLIATEEKAERIAAVRAILDRYATETTDAKLPTDMVYVTSYSLYTSAALPPEEPEMPGADYRYVATSWAIKLYRTKTEEELKSASKVSSARKEKDDRLAALRKLTAEAAERRNAFVLGLSPAAAAKHRLLLLSDLAYIIATNNRSYDSDDNIRAALGITDALDNLEDGLCKDEDDKGFRRIVREAAEAEDPDRLLLLLWWSEAHEPRDNFYRSYDGAYARNADLARVYDVLEKLGYDPTEDERRLRDGTHELFVREEETK